MVMGVSCRMLCVYNLAVRGLQMHCDRSPALSVENKSSSRTVKGHRTEFHMDTLSSHIGDEMICKGSIEEEAGENEEEEENEEDEEEEENDNEDDEKEDEEDIKEQGKDELAIQRQQKPAWSPGLAFFHSTVKEVYTFASQDIVIEEGLDSYAGMIWPAALSLCHYLDTHREQINLVDKAVLEIGAGTGLLSVVASLLGAWVTATDLPEVLSNLRVNLSRNTRGRCRHTPQAAALSWSFDLESTYPRSVYRYDYVLAADVVYHHDFLNELLATMKHFCRPGTTVIWANKVRFESDLTFTENFKKAFHVSLLAEDGDIKIFMATCRSEEEEGDAGMEGQDLQGQEEEETEDEEKDQNEPQLDDTEKSQAEENSSNAPEKPLTSEPGREGEDEQRDGSDEKKLEMIVTEDDDSIEDERDTPENGCSGCESSDEAGPEQAQTDQSATQQDRAPAWVPRSTDIFGRDIYHYVGHDIAIRESIDYFGAVMWPAALALCSFLDSNRQRVNLQGKKVLELGAGTGLVSIVASLLGASVTATDLPEVLSNLQANLTRNTRGRCRHTPQAAALSWSFDLKATYPRSVYHYDYVLAADVVYHHDFLKELLATMKHFCQPGTTVIWANKVRLESDLTFTENFKKAFHTSLLLEDGEMRIFMATCRESETQ